MDTVKELVKQWRKIASDKFMTNMIDCWSSEDYAFYSKCCDEMRAIEKQLVEEHGVEIVKAYFDHETQFKYRGEVI